MSIRLAAILAALTLAGCSESLEVPSSLTTDKAVADMAKEVGDCRSIGKGYILRLTPAYLRPQHRVVLEYVVFCALEGGGQ